jgi:hypothetical protein
LICASRLVLYQLFQGLFGSPKRKNQDLIRLRREKLMEESRGSLSQLSVWLVKEIEKIRESIYAGELSRGQAQGVRAVAEVGLSLLALRV